MVIKKMKMTTPIQFYSKKYKKEIDRLYEIDYNLLEKVKLEE